MHERAIRRIANYLTSTSTYMDLPDGNRRLFTHGIVYRTNKEKYTECYVDYDFSGEWDQADSDNAEDFMSHMV